MTRPLSLLAKLDDGTVAWTLPVLTTAPFALTDSTLPTSAAVLVVNRSAGLNVGPVTAADRGLVGRGAGIVWPDGV